MYYPYLRGRQFELIALREFAENHGSKNNVIPIIEPVKKNHSGFKLAIPKLIKGGVKFALILNPQNGDYKKSAFTLNGMEDLLKNTNNWIPAFIIKNNYKEIEDLIEFYNYDDIMLICSELTDTTNEVFQKLVMSQRVKYIVCQNNRTLKSLTVDTDKSLIRLDDNFNGQKRNIDYLDMAEEKFSEEHLFYRRDGFMGFSDYTCLSSQFVEGGSVPYAVSIHMTYEKSNKEIWIRHFTSKSYPTSTANIQAKFAEACVKALKFMDEENINTEAIEELRKYYTEAKYPGLGVVKKISIKHHLELVNSIL
ncbi:sce7725 family protein [Flavobacterium nitrogenifigens]|uniref:Sce7725 family protein n=1 Tax=Flavobacterium nitrogenifigens TaxID=1617283 RepID=A0A521AG45_9FLAO|nr:sce7725 family protein [Flavobacterium nitrogenifigens]KAF2331503.1 sce7725 family protein [Flavobacterium nitrogenifigens]SMO33718.1 hypothetical protein SAMN06265220_101102 [Flavobacterium nitrogenifigens]